ncbi:hypothetical protein SLS62_000677 [Diatrype stigma]|uniref:Rhodopsin domain-containing protein n=1 Tax=Diatrype stigma TaxID=117547 RepID=A0AAN9YX82_9PEZI
MCAKTAILLEWIHIFTPGRTRNTFFWTCWGMIATNIVFYLACIIAAQFTCRPVRLNWLGLHGRCRDRRALDTSTTVFNLVLDILILALPQRIIWKLQMNKQRKIGVSIVFSVGILYVFLNSKFRTVSIDYRNDVTYGVSGVLIWSIAEATCVILVFCIPTFPKTFKETAWLTKVKNLLNSWTKTYDQSSGESKLSLGHLRRGPPNDPEGLIPPSETYQRISDDDHIQEFPLTKVQKPATQVACHGRHHSGDCTHSEGGILRTTEFVTGVLPDTEGAHNQVLKQQHPWG